MNPPKKYAIIFPGQGSQHTKMGEELFAVYQQQALKASSLANFSIEQMSLESQYADKLNQTIHTQPCLYWVSYFSQQLRQEKGDLPPVKECVFAGHSLGEYVALAVAKVFDWETGFEIVVKRAQLMHAAAQNNEGTMAAVLGLKYETIKQIIDPIDAVEIANVNSLSQTVISGKKSAIEQAEKELKQNGAKRVVPLAVSGAFHSSQMTQVAAEFASFLKPIPFQSPSEIVYSNVTAKPFPNEIEKIKDLMVQQINHSVLWQPLVSQIAADYAITKENFVEVGPGKVLSNLIPRCF